MKYTGRAMKRAMETGDANRVFEKIPLIRDVTEFITPDKAQELLKKNANNRPVNWNKVEKYTKEMENGKWKFHAQGIIIDDKGNILTGQKRLWAIVYSGVGQWMRISRGTPSDAANLIDRGDPQTSRDIASRVTERKHSPTEVSITRAALALNGISRPSVDDIAEKIIEKGETLQAIIDQTRRIKKTKEILMILGVICETDKIDRLGDIEPLGEALKQELKPNDVKSCWNRGAAFTLAMNRAKEVLKMN